MAGNKYSAGVYEPDRLANQLFGTPGVQKNAGAAYGELAQGAGQVLQEEQQTQYVRNSNIISSIHAVGSFAAAALSKMKQVQAQHAAAQQAQRNMIEDADIDISKASLTDAANGKFNHLKETSVNDPKSAETQYSDFLDQQIDLIRNRFQDSPRGLAKIAPDLEEARARFKDRMSDWSLSTRAATAQTQGNLAVEQGLATVSAMTGNIASRQAQFDDILMDKSRQLNSQRSFLGDANVDMKLAELNRKMGPAFFQNLLNDAPKDPTARLQYLGEVRKIADKSNDAAPNRAAGFTNMYMHSEDKAAILRHMDSAENDAYTQLEYVNKANDALIGNRLLLAHAELNSNDENMTLQTTAIENAKSAMATIDAATMQIKADPTIPEKAKVSLINAKNAQIRQYDGLITIAQSNINRMKEKAATAARHAQSEAKADVRFAKQQRDAMQARQQQDLKELIYAKRQDMHDLILEDPVKNKPRMFELAGELRNLSDKAVKMGLRELGQSTSTDATKVATTAADHEPAVQGWGFGNIRFGAKEAPKRGSADYQAAQQKYLHEIQSYAANAAETDKLTQDFARQGANQKQQDKFAELIPTIRALYKDPIKRQQKLHEARIQVMADPLLKMAAQGRTTF